MRISTSMMYRSGMNTINSQQSDLMKLQHQIGTGKKVTSPSDDPLAAAQAVNLSQSMSINDQFAKNRSTAQLNLSYEEGVLDSMSTLMQDVRTRLVEAGNGTYSDADRASLATVLESARETLMGLANSRDGNGQYVFSGFKGNTAPFSTDPSGSVVWNGDTGQRLIQVEQTRQISASDNGYDLLMKAFSGDRSYLTAAAATNAGNGIISDPIITDGSGANVGNNFTLTFGGGSPNTYMVQVSDAAGSPVGGPTGPHTFTSGQELSLPGGVGVTVSGNPQAGDTFMVNAAKNESTNIFDTLDQAITALRQDSSGNPLAHSQLRNAITSSAQRLDVTYNAVLSTRSSVGARMQELDALQATGEQRKLGFEEAMSGLEDLDYYETISKLELRKVAFQAASQSFIKIQSLNLFTMNP